MDLTKYYPDIAAKYPAYVTQRELCEICRICPKTAYNLEQQGEIPYQIITSRDHPAMMYAPDLSKWLFNQMLGMGDMEHNRKLREERENKRPVITDTKQEIALWNIWVYYQKDIMRRLAQQKNTGGGASDDE